MKCYIMLRKGVFSPFLSSPNQCKEVGRKKYEYSLTIAFHERSVLDEQQFLIDHRDVDIAIQEIPLVRSCEQMVEDISHCVRGLFDRRKKSIVGLKCVISTGRRFVGQLTHIWVLRKSYLSLLNC